MTERRRRDLEQRANEALKRMNVWMGYLNEGKGPGYTRVMATLMGKDAKILARLCGELEQDPPRR